MFHIKSLLPKILQKRGIERQVEAAEICKIADRALEEMFGSKSTKALFFRNSTLQIKCPNSVLANEIRLQKETIRKDINRELGKEAIGDILTKIG